MNQAEMVSKMQQWNLAANRYYYACFHAVQALFIHNGLASKTHSGMLSQFGLHFIKTGIIEDRLSIHYITVHNFSTSSSKVSLLIALFFVTERQL